MFSMFRPHQQQSSSEAARADVQHVPLEPEAAEMSADAVPASDEQRAAPSAEPSAGGPGVWQVEAPDAAAQQPAAADDQPQEALEEALDEALEEALEEERGPAEPGEPADQAWPDMLAAALGGDARRPVRGRRLAAPEAPKRQTFTPQQRLLLLDTWQRSELPAREFAALLGISKHTLYKWKQLFDQHGPGGLVDEPRGARRGSRLPELTRRTILMLKQAHPEWGCQRISDMLLRGPALAASASAVARVLYEAGYELVNEPTRPHPQRVRRFERARPNQLWQTDLFTFVLKRHNRRVYLVVFMDDHSRFIVSYGLHATQSTALVLEALEAGLAAYGPPEEILTDNGPQYVTWRGTSRFTKHLEKRGIKQIVARPRRPQTLGKIERFWGTLWREFLEAAVLADLAEARTRIGHFIDYYDCASYCTPRYVSEKPRSLCFGSGTAGVFSRCAAARSATFWADLLSS